MPRIFRFASFVWLLSLLLASPAVAGTLGLVVAGDPAKVPVVETTLEPWLTKAGHEVRLHVLEQREVDKVVDCFILTDQRCAEPTVGSAGVAGMLFVMVEVKRDVKTKKDEVRLTGWLFAGDGKAITAQSVYCSDCRNDTLGPTAEDLARALFALADVGTGRLAITTSPPGSRVAVDAAMIGATPIEQGLRAGPHVVDITLDGHAPVRKDIDVGKDKTVTLDLRLQPVDGPVGGPKRGILPYVVLGGGAALVATGVAFYLMDQDCVAGGACDVPNTQETYRDSAKLGVGLGAAGVVALGVGVYLSMRKAPAAGGHAAARSTATPVGWVTPRGGGVGLTARF